jgi:hypothetical protein
LNTAFFASPTQLIYKQMSRTFDNSTSYLTPKHNQSINMRENFLVNEDRVLKKSNSFNSYPLKRAISKEKVSDILNTCTLKRNELAKKRSFTEEKIELDNSNICNLNCNLNSNCV